MTLEDLYRLLRAGHVQAQGIVDSIAVPLVVLDEALCVVNTNPSFLEAFRVSRDETIGACLLRLGSGQWSNPALERLLRDVIPKAASVIGFEVEHVFPGLGRRIMLVNARRLSHPDNNSNLLITTFEDVTERRDASARDDLLAAEVRHRFKNFLAIVSSLARQSPAEGLTASEFRDALLGRIDALASAELMAFGEEVVSLRAVLTRVTTPYGARVGVTSCPELRLGAREAASLSMILYELATNAAKYGALSVDGGKVVIDASLTGVGRPVLRLTWREQGGPATAPSPHQGFGSRLIEMIASHQLGGDALLEFFPAGLVATVSFPPDQAEG